MDKVLRYFKGDEMAASTWKNKYALPGEETPDDMHKRLAKEFARIEQKYALENASYSPLTEELIYECFKDFKYIIPGGSVMSGCGAEGLVSLSNCFVIGSPEDNYAKIMDTRNQQVQLMKRRGGVGYDLSKLRPRGAYVNNAAKSSTGAASFMDVCSDITNEVAQNGRRGALMISMHINHPDIMEFITKKQDLTKVTGANISVKVSDEFMNAVIRDEDYILRFPTDLSITEKHSAGDYDQLIQEEGIGWVKKVRAKELWDQLMYCAWNTAEPGILFEDTMIDNSPDGAYPKYRMISTNPCGEIPMGAFDSCRLIHVNLSSMVENPFTNEARFDFDLFKTISRTAMILGDDLIDLEIEAIDKILNKLSPIEDKLEYDLWQEIKNTTVSGRRCGVGFTGLSDMLAMLNISLHSFEALMMIQEVMQNFNNHLLSQSIDLASYRGAFLDFNAEVEKEGNTWYKDLELSDSKLFKAMQEIGRRNISYSTVAPTGTVSIMAGCTSGIEPLFLPYYERKRKCMSPEDRIDYTDVKGENYTIFTVVHPGLIHYASVQYPDVNLSGLDIEEWRAIYEKSPYFNNTAEYLDFKLRIAIQGVVQKSITHSISSTINLPNTCSIEDIENIYIEAWRMGNKGQTIYRDGCREGVLTSLNAPKLAPEATYTKRPKHLETDYYEITVKGEKFIVLIGLLDNKPYEIWAFRHDNEFKLGNHKGVITKIKKKHYSFESDLININDLQLTNTANEENFATLSTSALLRHGLDIDQIIKIIKKMNVSILSFSSAMCRILSKYAKPKQIKGEECPICGGALKREAGCIHCSECDYSKCE